MSVDADIPTSQDLLGVNVNALQTNIEVGEDAITGTLKKVTGYTGFSGLAEEQSGNYLALHCEVPNYDSATISVELVGGDHGPVTLDDDGLIIIRIKNVNQVVKVTASVAGLPSVTKSFALTNLVLQS